MQFPISVPVSFCVKSNFNLLQPFQAFECYHICLDLFCPFILWCLHFQQFLEFFCDAVSNSDYTESNDRKSDELWIEKEFKWIGYGLINVLSQHLPGRIAEPQKHQDSQWPSRDWNQANKSTALSLHQSIKCIMVMRHTHNLCLLSNIVQVQN